MKFYKDLMESGFSFDLLISIACDETWFDSIGPCADSSISECQRV